MIQLHYMYSSGETVCWIIGSQHFFPRTPFLNLQLSTDDQKFPNKKASERFPFKLHHRPNAIPGMLHKKKKTDTIRKQWEKFERFQQSAALLELNTMPSSTEKNFSSISSLELCEMHFREHFSISCVDADTMQEELPCTSALVTGLTWFPRPQWIYLIWCVFDKIHVFLGHLLFVLCLFQYSRPDETWQKFLI